jgi:hypothetical protein
VYRSSQIAKTIVLILYLSGSSSWGNDLYYQDDDLLCGPGFSPESYYQRIHQHAYQQCVSQAEYQQAVVRQLIAEKKSQEKIKIARRNRIEKEAHRREELIAKRKAERKQ